MDCHTDTYVAALGHMPQDRHMSSVMQVGRCVLGWHSMCNTGTLYYIFPADGGAGLAGVGADTACCPPALIMHLGLLPLFPPLCSTSAG